MIGALIGDSRGIGSDNLYSEEDRKSSRFDLKPREKIHAIRFKECDISSEGRLVKMHQPCFAQTIEKLSFSNFSAKDFAHVQKHVLYIVTCTRADNAFVCEQLAQVKPVEADSKDIRLLNSALTHLSKHPRVVEA